jgi:tRNA G18 (ribose-2'-O)-methylase SpoU
MITMKSNHKTKSEKEQRLLTYLSKKDKSEFEKLLEEAEKKKVPVRQCNIEDTACESCSG